jgi:uncharacterized membrane protein HdeD (DUF308 family)
MEMIKKNPNQTARFFTMLAYIAVLLGISQIAIGSILPPTSEKGLWLYAGLASLLLGYILTNPFYTPPADAFTIGVAGLAGTISPGDRGRRTGADGCVTLPPD